MNDRGDLGDLGDLGDMCDRGDLTTVVPMTNKATVV
jgi:hypothetical protein